MSYQFSIFLRHIFFVYSKMPLANKMLYAKTNNLKLPVLEIPNQGCMYALWAVGCFPGPY